MPTGNGEGVQLPPAHVASIYTTTYTSAKAAGLRAPVHAAATAAPAAQLSRAQPARPCRRSSCGRVRRLRTGTAQ